mgnify:CR=1 FL=1
MNKWTRFSFLLAGLFAVSCNNNQVLADLSVQEVNDQIGGHVWTVDRFVDDDDNYTGFFSGWTFDFQENGTLVADNNGTQYNGSWYVEEDDDDRRGKELYLFFDNGPDQLQDMEEDWYFDELSNNRMSLYDPELVGRDELVFVK